MSRHRLRAVPAAIGNGLIAATAGTAAMTLSSTLEMQWRHGETSDVPACAAARVLGVQPCGYAERRRFATIVHWAYGTGWGVVRGVIGVAGLRGVRAATVFFAMVWGSELVTLPRLGVGVPPVWRWDPAEIGVDALHHLGYTSVTSVVCDRLG